MFAKTVSRQFVNFSKKALMAVLVLVIVLIAMPTGSAQAWTHTQNTRTYGNVYVNPVIITEDFTGLYWNGAMVNAPSFKGSSDIVVERIPNTRGAQVVIVQYLVQKYTDRGWVTVAKAPVLIATMSSTQRTATFAAPNILLDTHGNGFFRFAAAVVWGTTSDVVLGSSLVTSNLITDYQCATTGYAFSCTPYAGSVYIKGIYSN